MLVCPFINNICCAILLLLFFFLTYKFTNLKFQLFMKRENVVTVKNIDTYLAYT